MATENVSRFLNSQSIPNHQEKTPPKRIVRLQLEAELADAIELIQEDIGRRNSRVGFSNTATILLKWACWAHSCGRDPYFELREGEPGGFGDWNTRIRAKREIAELEQLFRLGEEGAEGDEVHA